MEYIGEREKLMNSIQKYASEKQWREFVGTLSEGLSSQMIDYCKYWQGKVMIVLEKSLLTKDKAMKFSFLNFPLALYESSAEQKVDIIVTGELISFVDKLEKNEIYWKRILDYDKTGKSPDFGINYLLNEIYSELQNSLLDVIEELAKRNPLLHAPICMSAIQVSDSYKQGFVPSKLIESISNEIKDFSIKNEFRSERLRQIIYNLEDKCNELFGDFLVLFNNNNRTIS